MILNHFVNRDNKNKIPIINKYNYNPFSYKKRVSKSVSNIGDSSPPVVLSDFSMKKNISPASLFSVGYKYSFKLDKWNISDQACDYVFLGNNDLDFEVPGTLGLVYNYSKWLLKAKGFPYLNVDEYF